MSAGGGAIGATSGAASAGAVVEAIKASGVIVQVEPRAFRAILDRQSESLVIHATGGFFTTYHQYLTSYKGLAFFTKSPQKLDIPIDTELVEAKKIWVPMV